MTEREEEEFTLRSCNIYGFNYLGGTFQSLSIGLCYCTWKYYNMTACGMIGAPERKSTVNHHTG